jgi:hypothetical protein
MRIRISSIKSIFRQFLPTSLLPQLKGTTRVRFFANKIMEEIDTPEGNEMGEGGISKNELKRRLKAAQKEKEKEEKAAAKAAKAAAAPPKTTSDGASSAAADEDVDPSKLVLTSGLFCI